ncbi:UDP-N-acetylmuramate--L-alanine ligase [Hippea maritima]|uniref:UDP-N-acetylmuramate--L-alanine ligase n=1 Tax=Hippea maritima (strain ATCC 700847 / DSM 10411 / MH2) TaxID=760142 RepID=F2LW05_HIPMA|nr:UDP-N-acetylmuramate--L-alanine ligase [Hippea maritima]AEA33939.1 UDP-N-acetylmuramate--L-alanine ligase [Hippea maritima DSM 10411]
MFNEIINNAKKVHFVGIGGVGMSSLAQYLLSKGYTITGSDVEENSYVEKLKKQGVKVYLGHSLSNIEEDVDLVVVSSAVKNDNIELIQADKLNIPTIKRYQLLAHLVNNSNSIAVAGSHGKTTTTSLSASLLKNANLDPTAIIGGKLRNINNNVIIGKCNYLIVEADESDGGFLLLNPKIGLLTNIDNDHLGFYGNFENEKVAFYDFMDNSEKLIINIDDPIIKQWKNLSKRQNLLTYSIKSKKADVYAYDIQTNAAYSIFSIKTPTKKIEQIKLKIIGTHNISNALAVVCLAEILEIGEDIIRKTLSEFEGVDRRFTYVGNYRNLKVYDDYAHHPTEIRETLKAAKLISKNIYAVFQPHRFSRTAYLMDEFAGSFKDAKRVFVLDIFPASESPIDGIDSQILAQKVNEISANAVYINNEDMLKKHLDQIEEDGVVVALGAGSVSRIIRKITNDYKNITT